MADELSCDLCDPSSPVAPPGWESVITDAGLHQVWDWSLVRAVHVEARGRLLAGLLRDGDRLVGLVTARLHGLRRSPSLGVVDVDAVGNSALPGIALPGAVPGSLDPSGTDPALLAAAIRAFESALRERYGRRVAAVVYRQVYARELPLVARGGTVIREGSPTAVLHNVSGDYAGYLRTLSKSRRVDQRRIARRIDDDPSVRVYTGPAGGTTLDLDAFHRLVVDTTRRNHGARWPRPTFWSPARLAAAAALPGTDVVSYTDPDGELLAASLIFGHPTSPIVGPWGSRPVGTPGGRRSGLWFDQFNRAVNRAIDDGCRIMIIGKGLSDLKEKLGFTPEPQWVVVRRLTRIP